MLHTIGMDNCCCKGCAFNAGTATRGDDAYTVPESTKFEGPAAETVKYGEKL